MKSCRGCGVDAVARSGRYSGSMAAEIGTIVEAIHENSVTVYYSSNVAISYLWHVVPVCW